MLLVLIFISCGKKGDEKQEQSNRDEVTSEVVPAAEFQQKLQSTQGAVLLDVRTPEEYAQGFIEGATNINFNAEDFKAKVESLDKNATYFVYCAGGGRSGKAANLMKELKFKSVYDLDGGYNGWKASGLPTKPE